MRHVTIPARWTGTEALCVVGFLERIIEAVWRQHGEAMAEHLYAAAAEHVTASAIAPIPIVSEPLDDDLPL